MTPSELAELVKRIDEALRTHDHNDDMDCTIPQARHDLRRLVEELTERSQLKESLRYQLLAALGEER